MPINYSAYNGNNDFRGFLSSQAPQYLSYTGNDGKVDQSGLARSLYGTGKVLGNDATGVRMAQSEGNNDANWQKYQYNPSVISGLYDNWSAAQSGGGGGGAYTSGGGSGGGAPGYSAADERAYYDDQINQINSLFGITNTQRDSGLQRLNDSFGQQTARLGEQQAKTNQGYDEQGVQNAQDKQRGVESVDNFANNSYNSLQRLLQGGHAGNSSVGRELVPYLISKGAGAQRQGVFDQAGKNDQNIASARGDAADQFRYSNEDLGNQRKSQEQQFREGILNKQNELLGQRAGLEQQRAQANGGGYAAARAASEASRNGINDRTSQLQSLFGQFQPSFNARAVNTKTPELGQYTVDGAQIRSDQNLPAESRYYLPQLKKKEQGQF